MYKLCIALILFIIILGILIYKFNPKCECPNPIPYTKNIHTNPWTQFIWCGKVMVPIYHPGRDYTVEACLICDKEIRRNNDIHRN